MEGVLGPLVAVEGDGIAVHLVLNLRQDMKQFTVGLHAYDLRWKAKKQFVGAVPVVFGQACDRDVEMQLILYHLTNDIHLTFATIRDDKIGEGRAFFFHARIATAYNLLHGGVVVRACDRLDVVFAIVLTRRLHAFIHDTTRYGVRTGDVGVIKTFDLIRQFVKVQLVL